MNTEPVAPCGCIFPSPADTDGDPSWPKGMCFFHSATAMKLTHFSPATKCTKYSVNCAEGPPKYLALHLDPSVNWTDQAAVEIECLCETCVIRFLDTFGDTALAFEMPVNQIFLTHGPAPRCHYSYGDDGKLDGEWRIEG